MVPRAAICCCLYSAHMAGNGKCFRNIDAAMPREGTKRSIGLDFWGWRKFSLGAAPQRPRIKAEENA